MLYDYCHLGHDRTSDKSLRQAFTEEIVDNSKVTVQRAPNIVIYIRSLLRYNFTCLSSNSADVGGSLG